MTIRAVTTIASLGRHHHPSRRLSPKALRYFRLWTGVYFINFYEVVAETLQRFWIKLGLLKCLPNIGFQLNAVLADSFWRSHLITLVALSSTLFVIAKWTRTIETH